MRNRLLFLLAATLLVGVAIVNIHGQGNFGKPSPTKALEIYFIDTEGGQSNLVVTPTGDSMLLDTGSPMSTNPNAPQPPVDTAARIMAVLKQAGIQTLDYMIISHYHGDHVGNAAEIAKRIPVRHVYDRGGWTVEASPQRAAGFLSWKAVRDYMPVTVPKIGERVPITGIDAEFVATTNEVTKIPEVLKTPMIGEPGAGASNPECKEFVAKLMDPTPENYYSLGMTFKYNNWRMLDLFDLTWNQEKDLVCPNNLLGTFDLYHTTRHGTTWSGAPVLVHATHAPIVVMNNGARKGGEPDTFKTIKSIPGFQDLWQEHYSEMYTDANPPEQFIANMNTQDHGHNFHLTVRPDGSATMVNERNGFKKEYPAKRITKAATSEASR
jgi:competence protein ComEC